MENIVSHLSYEDLYSLASTAKLFQTTYRLRAVFMKLERYAMFFGDCEPEEQWDDELFCLSDAQPGEFGWAPFFMIIVEESLHAKDGKQVLDIVGVSPAFDRFDRDGPTDAYLFIEQTKSSVGLKTPYFDDHDRFLTELDKSENLDWDSDLAGRLVRATPKLLKSRFECPECQGSGRMTVGTADVGKRWPRFRTLYQYKMPCPRCEVTYEHAVNYKWGMDEAMEEAYYEDYFSERTPTCGEPWNSVTTTPIMSVVPREVNLVMSFADATRVFNTDQSNMGSFVPDQMVTITNPDHEQDIDGDDEYYTNYWFQTRSWMRVYFAEFLGTMILVVWGEGYLSVAWGWGVGFMLAIYVSSGISVYYVPLHTLGNFDAVLTTGPSALNPTVLSTFFSVFIGAALLMGAIAAFTDTGNNPATPGLTPLLLGLVMVGIASSFGYQTGFVLNPARDLGPRLFLWVTGSSGHELWIEQHAYGIWTPLIGTVTGAIFGILMYDLLIYNGRDSPVNFNYSRRNRRRAKSSRAHEQDVEKGTQISVSTVATPPSPPSPLSPHKD
ncbi:hypothetical protein RQP46_006320 [Phenoliferia psychrophenolica]